MITMPLDTGPSSNARSASSAVSPFSPSPRKPPLTPLPANMPAIYQLIKTWKPKLVSGTTRGTRSKSGGTAPTPDLKGSIVNGKFVASNMAPRLRTMPHERSSSEEYLQWSKEVDANTIELGQTPRGTRSPESVSIPPGTAF
jgi:hypothetical protein